MSSPSHRHVCRVLTMGLLAAAMIAGSSGCVVHDIRDGIAVTNEQLTAVDARLAAVEQQLQTLQSIDTSLSHLDAHLASLRKTIDNIDSTIPFLSISADSEDEEADGETGDNPAPGGGQDPG